MSKPRTTALLVHAAANLSRSHATIDFVDAVLKKLEENQPLSFLESKALSELALLDLSMTADVIEEGQRRNFQIKPFDPPSQSRKSEDN